jgi:hypothetical protein
MHLRKQTVMPLLIGLPDGIYVSYSYPFSRSNPGTVAADRQIVQEGMITNKPIDLSSDYVYQYQKNNKRYEHLLKTIYFRLTDKSIIFLA